MSVVRYFLFLLCFLFLQACGGSSNSNSEEQEEFRFELNAVLSNKCGITSAFTDYEFFLQDENWQTLKKYQPNSRGQVSFVISKEKINYTLVAKSQQGEQLEGYELVSVANIATASTLTYQATFDSKIKNNNCACYQHDVLLKHRPFSERDSVQTSANYQTWQVVDERSTQFTNVEICQNSEGNWPLHSFAVIGKDDLGETIGAAEFFDDFTPNSEGIWQISALEVLDYHTQIQANVTDITSTQVVNGDNHLPISIAPDQTNVNTFKNHLYVNDVEYRSQSSYQLAQQDSILGRTSVTSRHTITSEILDESLLVIAETETPDIDLNNLSFVGAERLYEFSNIRNYPAVIMTFDISKPIGDVLIPLKWTFIGEQTGTLPFVDLAGYEQLNLSQNDATSTEIRLINSVYHQDYQSYLQSLLINIEHDLSKEYREYIFTIEK